ncbi:MAG: replication-associated recombination protein A [Opitutales bacterium]|nr:replication-associated recombination protein A [Opitutales bacterium]
MQSSIPLFERKDSTRNQAPLPERMRPQSFETMVGQPHLLSKESSFQRWLQQGGSGNVLLYGPPGCGKTTLAQLIAKHLQKHLLVVNAVLSNLNDLRSRIQQASQDPQAILFIDEIHRFNKSQQDVLLPFCESGTIQLIGATTHNPAFYLIPPLLSRSYVFELHKLPPEAILQTLCLALQDEKHGLGASHIKVPEEILSDIARIADGDMRRALHLLEFLCLSAPIGSTLDPKQVASELKHWHASYNARETDHYDMISAYIKSIRGCDPDAATYWLARMLKGGEDPLFIARRLVILASEDVGLADSRGLLLAAAAYTACEKIGMPECAINLSHVTIFLALVPKSNSTNEALNAAYHLIAHEVPQAVPNALQQTPLHREDPYRYSHQFEANVSGQAYWNEAKPLYHLKPIGAEKSFEPLYRYRQQLREQIRKKQQHPS